MIIKPLVAAALALGSVAIVPTADAQVHGYGYGAPELRYEQPYREDYRQQEYQRDGYYQSGRGYGYDQRAYDQRGYDPRRYDGRSYRRCNNGTTGTLLGALAGGLLGRSIGGRGDRAAGTIVGAGAGALAGRAIERSNNQGYCR